MSSSRTLFRLAALALLTAVAVTYAAMVSATQVPDPAYEGAGPVEAAEPMAAPVESADDPYEVAGVPAGSCGCPVQYVEKTICVPCQVTEMRTVTCTEQHPETRYTKVCVKEQVAHVTVIPRCKTVIVHETRHADVCCHEQVPIYKRETGSYELPKFEEVKVPAMGTSVKMVPVTENRTVVEDHGHWAERCCKSLCKKACGKCGAKCGQPCTCKVWVPNMVRTTVPFTELVPKEIEVPYDHVAIEGSREPKTWERYTPVCWEDKCEVKSIPYTVCVPKKVDYEEECVTYSCKNVNRAVPYTVMVPHVVTKEVPVTVCKMVHKTIKVPVCCHSCGR